ncbi:amino acid permease [Pseudonocardia terrae]|uniref:amino acid permease n=1 Tax=Pseudonocardia terrae TaxID=2905831 RepID=UPI002104AB56|nr:amino acid permease [Pseudonocardia terrae]
MTSDALGAGEARAAAPAKRRISAGTISWTALALMTVSSVASLRPAPTMAVYGLACVFLYVLPAIVFLIPTALVSAELASGWSGGVYRWVTEGMSPNMGFAAAWHQFAMTIFYNPPCSRSSPARSPTSSTPISPPAGSSPRW